MELNEQAEKTGRKRRRKRTREGDGEVMENFLKRKPSTPVKPPVSKKARVPLKLEKSFIDLKDVTDFVVLDSGSSQPVQPVKKAKQNSKKQRRL